MHVVLGKSGMLGGAFIEALHLRGEPARWFGRDECDITDRTALDVAIPEGTRIVLNCAAWTDVDAAETMEAEATRINATALAALSKRCARVRARLVSFSTDYVFDGAAQAPYSVDADPRPLNAYGRSKAAGERVLAAGPARHLLVRTSGLYAPWGRNFVRTILARANEPLSIVDDQTFRPTSARYLAERTLALIERGAVGTWHVTDGGECTWYQLALAIVRASGANGSVSRCSSESLARPAQRPRYSVLDLSHTEHLVGESRNWLRSVREVVRCCSVS